jgi:hypothetical protein
MKAGSSGSQSQPSGGTNLERFIDAAFHTLDSTQSPQRELTMPTSSIEDFLKSSPYFSNQQGDFSSKFQELLSEKEIEDGTVLLHEGEKVQKLYL